MAISILLNRLGIKSLPYYTSSMRLLLHLTRGIRWDSDHVLTFNDELLLITQEIVRCKALEQSDVGLDFFDASLNRIGAYVIGTRSAQMAFMYALLEPFEDTFKI